MIISDKSTYEQAVKKLEDMAFAYYTQDNPIASDDEYDMLYRAVRTYEKQNPDDIISRSMSQRIEPNIQNRSQEATIIDAFTKASHHQRLYSLEDIFNETELEAWIKRANKKGEVGSYICEGKFDGASLNLIYENGMLKQAITRGDGFIGEEVTHNARVIEGIPACIEIKEFIEIRGEVLIRKKDFEQINKERLKQGLELFANARNTASASLRQLNANITKKRKLLFLPWGLGVNHLVQNTSYEKMQIIYKQGFINPPKIALCNNLTDIQRVYKEFLTIKDNLEILLDGMVIKVNDEKIQQALGHTVKFPRFAAAYKFPAIEKSTVLKKVQLQVGRTGVITPVAIVKPVLIEGVTVSKASLHNFDEIKRKNLHINDKVLIIRSGDVIPKIIKAIDQDNRKELLQTIEKPKNCPECQSELLEEDILLKCVNLKCPARVLNNLIYCCSKSCLNIAGMGKKVLELLYKKKIIQNISDIFKLQYQDLEGLEGFQNKKITKLLQAISATKKVSLQRFINALGIECIGEVAAKSIAENFGVDFIKKSIEDFSSLDGIGDEMAQSIVDFVNLNKILIEELMTILDPVEPKELSLNTKIQTIFSGKSFVITGTLSQNRDTIKSKLEKLGAICFSTISNKTDYLLAGEKAGSKLAKAKALDITIIDEVTLEKMMKVK